MENILININELVLIIGLAIESLFDVRFKKIPLWVLYTVAGVGITTGIIYLIVSDTDGIKASFISRVIAAIVGLLLLFVSKLSKESIGYGDSLVFLTIGMIMGIETLLSVLLMSISLAGVAGLVFLLIFKKNRKYQLPFVPFIFISYVLLRLINVWVTGNAI